MGVGGGGGMAMLDEGRTAPEGATTGAELLTTGEGGAGIGARGQLLEPQGKPKKTPPRMAQLAALVLAQSEL